MLHDLEFFSEKLSMKKFKHFAMLVKVKVIVRVNFLVKENFNVKVKVNLAIFLKLKHFVKVKDLEIVKAGLFLLLLKLTVVNFNGEFEFNSQYQVHLGVQLT